jgi:hypothetical protein
MGWPGPTIVGIPWMFSLAGRSLKRASKASGSTVS